MNIGLLRQLLGVSSGQLADVLGYGPDQAATIHAWEGGAPVPAPAAIALTYLAQGAFAEASGVPEFLIADERERSGPGAACFLIRSWRPRFIAIAAAADIPLGPHQSWAWIERDVSRLVVLQWWDDPADADALRLIERAASRIPAAPPAPDRRKPLLAAHIRPELFQRSHGFVALLQGPTHVFQYVNDSLVRMMGSRDFIGRPVREAVPDIEGQGFFELLDQVYATGERVVASELPLRVRRNGADDLRFIDFVYEPVTDEAGRVTGIFVDGYDVTERREAQAALKSMARHIASVFPSS